jgi:hypothetical protein
MSAELLQSVSGVNIVHVPYRGGGPAMNDLLGGQIELMVDGLPSAMPHIKAGSIKALAVTTSARAASAPEIPTVAETVPGYEAVAWFGLVVPKGTPKEAIEKLTAVASVGPGEGSLRGIGRGSRRWHSGRAQASDRFGTQEVGGCRQEDRGPRRLVRRRLDDEVIHL